MAKKVVFSPIGSLDTRREAVERIKEYLKNGRQDEVYVLVPSTALVDQLLLELIDTSARAFRIGGFDGMVEEILKAAGIKRGSVGRDFYRRIIANIVRKLAGENRLEYFGRLAGYRGFINSVVFTIGEIKRAGITPQEYLERTMRLVEEGKLPGSFAGKYRDIYSIYRKYQDFLGEKALADPEERYILAEKYLKENNGKFFESISFMYLDGFVDLEPLPIKLLNIAAAKVDEIYINMPYKTGRNYGIVKNTLEKFKEMGFQVEVVEVAQRRSCIDAVTDNLFSGKKVGLSPGDRIILVKAENREGELKAIAREIKKLEGIDPWDIFVAVRDMESYGEDIIRVFGEEHINVSMNREVSLDRGAPVKEILACFEARLQNFSKKAILRLLKTRRVSRILMEDLKPEVLDEMEAVIYRLPVYSGKDEWGRAIEREIRRLERLGISQEFDRDTEALYEEIEQVKRAGERLQVLLDRIDGDIRESDTLGNYLDFTCRLICRIREQLKSELKGEKSVVLINEIKAVEKMNEVVEDWRHQMEIMGQLNRKGTLEDFVADLKESMMGVSYTEQYGNFDGVQVMAPEAARGLKFKWVFIVGMNEGVFPVVPPRDWVYREREKIVLKNAGFKLDTFEDIMEAEKLLFHCMVAAAEEGLCLSSFSAGREIPSAFIDEIREITCQNVKEVLIPGWRPIPGRFSEVSSLRDLREAVFYSIYNGYAEEEKGTFDTAAAFLASDKGYFRKTFKMCEIERDRYSQNRHGCYDGRLDQQEVLEHVRKRCGRVSFSVSQMDTFGECSFYYFCRYVLGLKEFEEPEEFSPIERGNLYHRVLERYYSKMEGFEVNEELLRGILDQEFDRIFGIYGDNRLWQLRREQTFQILRDFIKKDMEFLALTRVGSRAGEKDQILGRMEPALFEVEFSAEIGGDILFKGKIDRIDLEKTDKGYTGRFVVYDYKAASSKGHKDIEEGLSFQLPIYIHGARKILEEKAEEFGIPRENIEWVGSAFYHLKDGKRSNCLWNKKYGRSMGFTRSSRGWYDGDEGLNSLMERVEGYIKEYMSRMESGEYIVDPKRCNSYCPYRPVCRYDRLRIDGKKGGQ